MQQRLSIWMFFAVFKFAAPALRAQAADDAKPSAANVNGAEYPRIPSDGRVTFRVKVPTAQKVQVQPFNGNVGNTGYNGLGTEPYEMTKDNNGFGP
jgi:hypothetical protein